MPTVRSTKRPRPAGLDGALQARLADVQTADALALASHIDARSPTGVASDGKRAPLLAQVTRFKEDHPRRLVLVRVGEFYEAFGADAVLLVEHSPANVSAKALPVVRATSHAARIQYLLDDVVGKTTLHVAIYEETAVLCTPRQRVLRQIVSRAQPSYIGCTRESVHDAARLALVHVGHDGIDVCLLDIPERLCRIRRVQSDSHALALVSTALRPVLALQARPAWLHDEVIIVGGSHAPEALMEHAAREHGVAVSEMRKVVDDDDACMPLTRFTAAQLGLVGDMDVESLATAAVGKSAPACVREQVRRWLMIPPPRAYARVLRATTLALREQGLPQAVHLTRPGERVRHVHHATLDAIGAHHMRQHVGLCAHRVADALRAAVGCAIDDLDACEAAFARHLTPDGALKDAALAEAHVALDSAQATLGGLLEATYHPDQLVFHHAVFVGVRGRVDDAAGKLRVVDVGGRPVAGVFTTPELERAKEGVATAKERVKTSETAAMEALCDELRASRVCETLATSERLALELATLYEHTRVATSRRWVAPSTSADGCCAVDGLSPYWFDARTNDVSLDGVHVLTAPNGGGKTTFLRALGAMALLHQCGLHVPARRAAIPEYAAVFVRAGALDSATHHMSAFAREMSDMSLMMHARGSLVLVDEPCRGTAAHEGEALLTAILDELHPSITAVFATHFHTLRPTRADVRYMQLYARVDGLVCRPTFELVPGRCSQSHALHMAIAAGLPLAVVQRARAEHDDETACLGVMRALDLVFTRVRSDAHPPLYKANVYALLTRDGVYVGETNELGRRIGEHRAAKPAFDEYLCIACASREDARRLESRLIRALQQARVRLLSVTDGAHVVG